MTTPNAPLRYGIVGVGMMGIEHMLNIGALDGAEVVAVADPDDGSLETARRVASENGLPTPESFGSHVGLANAGSCDVIVIASPNMTHAEVLGDLLGTPHHLLVEKPLCTTVEDCERVVAQADGHDHLIWVGLEYRFMAPVARLIEEVHAGTAGKLRMLSLREHRFPFLPKVADWNRFNANTGGTLVEKCCHFFDLMNHVIGDEPLRVYARGGQAVNHLNESYDGKTPDIIDHAIVVVDYPESIVATLDLCMFAEATKNQEEIVAVGDAGKIEALIPEDVIRIGRRGTHFIGTVEEFNVADERVAYQGLHHGSSYIEHLHLRDAIRSGEAASVGLRDGLLSVAMGVAGQRSIELGRPVELHEVLNVAQTWDSSAMRNEEGSEDE